jgi:hypothetical protein
MKTDLKTLGLLLVIGVLCLYVYGEYFVEMPAEVWIYEQEKTSAGATVEHISVKNNLATPQVVYVEAGIIPRSVSDEWFGYGFSFIAPTPKDCCAGQQNIKGMQVTLMPYETQQITLILTNPYNGIADKCGNTNYYAADGKYKVYAIVSNHCNWLNGVKQTGYENYDKFVSDY